MTICLQEVRKVNKLDQARGIIDGKKGQPLANPGVVILSGNATKTQEQKNKGKVSWLHNVLHSYFTSSFFY